MPYRAAVIPPEPQPREANWLLGRVGLSNLDHVGNDFGLDQACFGPSTTAIPTWHMRRRSVLADRAVLESAWNGGSMTRYMNQYSLLIPEITLG
ncbi:hypothetical protein HETIRDRAFT_470021 [Heterobasidion irregulare TC 32-1]|uniref:Uncharacterized protein n=1 Tax=Heterobasidion irregulare (strain TC 32-1) TaxID=747525 RepID=W4KPU9_HETIT|nr:uncharacterized protein HETIRDRAFT_470021 [Heterobasidion irregulare TC 32-1]ETW87817.1 hypothetical protein HETIRDRAFT_470021 [Heterobasidion irregulare TC 32-1]